ncbi:MAG: hypothetical protein ACJAQT_000220 [Akkermansiaceae bacterium]
MREERLEEVVILSVDQGDLKAVMIGEGFGAVQSGKSSANDEDAAG